MSVFSKYWISRILILIISVGAIVYMLPRGSEEKLSYNEGDVWRYDDLAAPHEMPIYLDSATIEHRKDSIRQQFVPIYKRDNMVLTNIENTLSQQLGENYMLRLEITRIIEDYYKSRPGNTPNGVVSSQDFNKIQNGQLAYVRIPGEKTAVLEHTRTMGFVTPAQIIEKIKSNSPDSASLAAIDQLDLPALIAPNIIEDTVATQRDLEQMLTNVSAPIGVIKKGDIIIHQGDKITTQHINILKDYETTIEAKRKAAQPPVLGILIGQAGFVLILLCSLYLYLILFCRSMFDRLKTLLFIMLMIVGFFALSAVSITVWSNGLFVIPIVIIPILIKVFFDGRTALFCFLIEVLLCAVIARLPFEYIFIEICGGLAAIFSLNELSRRSQLLRSALFILCAYALSYAAFELLTSGSLSTISLRVMGVLAINALLSSFAYILLFIVEKVFGYISMVTLVELSDINAPLLRKLSEECPGTFQHSMAVSNLASDAARRIGANEQLVRAGALYHDIGKMSNPAFFTENQRGVNPHDTLEPMQSAEIVIGHVTDGLRRAEKAKLPAIIRDFISEHHGAGKAKYFYNTYYNAHPDEVVDAAPFTYPGPNPRSKETSILMMSDAVEAASRSLQEYTPETIANLVNRIVDGQIADGLHNDSPLSFRDIATIKDAFVNRLRTMYHTRISYPDDPKPKN